MRIYYAPRLLGVWAALSLVMAGCGEKARLEVYPVSGRVEYQGQGVPKATVIFHSTQPAVEGERQLRPFAYADDDGNFRLKTYVTDDGAAPGEYKVRIVAASHGSVAPSKDAPVQEASPPAPGPKIPPAITAKYGDAETSGIVVQIKEGENQLPPFQLN
jgi:hypothetical protein